MPSPYLSARRFPCPVPFRRRREHQRSVLPALLLLLVGVVPTGLGAQGAGGLRLSLEDIEGMLRGNRTAGRVTALVLENCYAGGEITPAVERRLGQLGATPALVNALRRSPCPAQGPASRSSASQGGAVLSTGAGLGMGFGTEQFVVLPAGSFRMGSTNGDSDEQPVHTVHVSRFALQRTEVTQGQWHDVMGVNPSQFSNCGDRCPVERVSWDDIQLFLQRLNARDPGKGYRLPTEAEWEYAARAGTTGDYGGTGRPDDMGWYRENGVGGPQPVAQKQPNAWGLYDLHGNVWEWVADWYGQYRAEDQWDPKGPTYVGNRDMRVLRGGAWDGYANLARAANRSSTTPVTRSYTFGFRLARSP